MRETIRYWLEPYIDKDQLDSVSGMIFHIAWTHSKTSFAIGLVLGSLATGLLIRWLS